MAATKAANNRAIRQEALREQLAEKCRLQHVLDNIQKMEEQGISMEPQEFQALKTANEQRIKLLNKYIPDLKSTELTGEGGGDITIAAYQVEFKD